MPALRKMTPTSLCADVVYIEANRFSTNRFLDYMLGNTLAVNNAYLVQHNSNVDEVGTC